MFGRIPPREIVSIIPVFLDYIRQGRLRGVLADDGLWMDMGTPEAYIQAHLDFPSPAPRIHPGAEVSSGASVDAASVNRPPRHRGGRLPPQGVRRLGPAPACPQAPVRNGGFFIYPFDCQPCLFCVFSFSFYFSAAPSRRSTACSPEKTASCPCGTS